MFKQNEWQPKKMNKRDPGKGRMQKGHTRLTAILDTATIRHYGNRILEREAII